MKEARKAALEARGWRIGTATELLGLTPEEETLVDLRLRLADAVRDLRKSRSLTQAQLAERLGSSQSRVAKVEAGSDSVSLDLLIRSYLALGASAQDLATVIGRQLAPPTS